VRYPGGARRASWMCCSATSRAWCRASRRRRGARARAGRRAQVHRAHGVAVRGAQRVRALPALLWHRQVTGARRRARRGRRQSFTSSAPDATCAGRAEALVQGAPQAGQLHRVRCELSLCYECLPMLCWLSMPSSCGPWPRRAVAQAFTGTCWSGVV